MRDHPGEHAGRAVTSPAVTRPVAPRPAPAVTEAVTQPIGPIEPPVPPQERGGWPTYVAFALVLLVAAVGMVRIGLYHWREGAVLIGGALVLAGFCRAVLPTRVIGLLAVRGRVVDVLSYLALAAMILFVAITLTGGPFG